MKPPPPEPKRVTGWLCLHPEEFIIRQILAPAPPQEKEKPQ